MYKYHIYSINGVRGCVTYDTFKEALKAAKMRSSISHSAWYVSAVKVG